MNAQRLLATLFGNQRIDQHHEDAEDAQHQLRKNPDVVDGRNHRPITCQKCFVSYGSRSELQPGCMPENCLSAADTDGSMECSHSRGQRP